MTTSSQEIEMDAAHVAAEAQSLQAAALERGVMLSAAEAVRQVLEGVPKSAGDKFTEQAELLRHQAQQRGEALGVTKAFQIARNPGSPEAIALRARHELFQAARDGFPIDTLQAFERAKRYCTDTAAALDEEAAQSSAARQPEEFEGDEGDGVMHITDDVPAVRFFPPGQR